MGTTVRPLMASRGERAKAALGYGKQKISGGLVQEP